MNLITLAKTGKVIAQDDIERVEIPKKNLLTVENIRKVVCNEFGIKENVIDSRCRKREIVQARQVWQSLISDKIRLSLSRIGELTGGYDHATVLFSKKTVRNLYESNKDYKKIINEIYKKLGL